jgi:uncharacterized membrane protein YhaH (DUF805 family)
MINSYRSFWRKSFDYKGRTERADFWLAVGANAIVIIAVLALGALLVGLWGDSATAGPIAFLVIYSLAAILPNISIQARRLRDAGFSPWLLLLSLIPYIGGIILFIMYLQPSKTSSQDSGRDRYAGT